MRKNETMRKETVTNIQWHDWFRIITSLLAFIALTAHAYRGRRLWDDFTGRNKDLWWSYIAILFAVFYGNAEAVINNVEWETRGIISFLAVVVSLRVVILDYRHDKEDRVKKVRRSKKAMRSK